jgi:amino acid transporter
MIDQNLTLKSNGVGLVGAVTLGVVMLSPAMTLYESFGPCFLSAGKAAPLTFVWALLATLPTAVSYSVLSRDYPDSGSAASWIAGATRAWVGGWAGWLVFCYYFGNFILQPIAFGVFLNDLLQTLGLPHGFLTYALGAVGCCLWAASIVYRGITPSVKGALGLLLVESVVVVSLCATVIWVVSGQGIHPSLEGFHLSASPRGAPGLFQAMVFGMLSYCGFDVISTLGEEARMPRTLIPRATFLALLAFGLLMIGGVWCLTYAASPERLAAVAESGGMPISEIARRYWGRGSLLVSVTALTASLGIAIATSVGASRVLFSMARQGTAPVCFAILSPSHRAPARALDLIFGAGLAGGLLTGLVLGPYRSFTWWGTASTFFAMMTYLFVNTSNLLLNRRRLFASRHGFLFHGAVPLLGLAVDGYLLVRSFFVELWRQGWADGQSIIAFSLICSSGTLVYALSARARRGAPPATAGAR